MSVHRERVFINIMWGYQTSRNWCFTRTQLKVLLTMGIISLGFMVAVTTWSLLKIRENGLLAGELASVKHSLFKLQAAQEDVFNRAYPPRSPEDPKNNDPEPSKIAAITDPTIETGTEIQVAAEIAGEDVEAGDSHEEEPAIQPVSFVSLNKLVLVRQTNSLTLEYDLVNRRSATVDGYLWLTFKKGDQIVGRLPGRMRWDPEAEKPSNYRESWRFKLRNFVHKSVVIPRELENFDTFVVTIAGPDGARASTLTFRRHEISTVSAEIS